MSKMKGNMPPPVKNDEQAFIEGANASNSELPWNASKVREDMIKLVSLRLSEPYYLKLVWLAEQTGKSQQRLVQDVLLPWIDEAVAEQLAKQSE